jgi:hypothetical protein
MVCSVARASPSAVGTAPTPPRRIVTSAATRPRPRRPHGHAQVGRGQRRGVVDPVAHHRHGAPRGARRATTAAFSSGRVSACTSPTPTDERHRQRRRPPVARGHCHPDAHRRQRRHRRGASGRTVSASATRPATAPSMATNTPSRPARGRCRSGSSAVGVDPLRRQPAGRADAPATAHAGPHPSPGRRRELRRGGDPVSPAPAPATIARASGCSLPASAAATNARSSSSPRPHGRAPASRAIRPR